MSHAVQEQNSLTRTSEKAAVDHLIERLAQRFPEVPRADIMRSVEGRYAEFEQSKVRDFVPVLVERAARDELGNSHPRL